MMFNEFLCLLSMPGYHYNYYYLTPPTQSPVVLARLVDESYAYMANYI